MYQPKIMRRPFSQEKMSELNSDVHQHQLSLRLQDNSTQNCLVDEKTFTALLSLSNKPLSQLLASSKQLVYGYGLNDEQELLQVSLNKAMAQGYDVTIRTFNLVGFLQVGSVPISITSRFCQGTEHEDYLLRGLLYAVQKLPVIASEHTATQGTELELAFLLFAPFLQQAVAQGIYRTPQQQRFNEPKIHGAVDIAAQLKYNLPFNGLITSTNRMATCDNPLNRLICHAAAKMRLHPLGQKLISYLPALKRNLQLIEQCAPSYRDYEIAATIHANSRPLTHPFFTNYEPLRRLCLQIIKEESPLYAMPVEDRVTGLLCDIARLYEDWIALQLHELNFVHADNVERQHPIYLAQNRGLPRYPDFYNISVTNGNMVFDAKYKRGNSSFLREDIHQVITYMYSICASCGGLIFPQLEREVAYKLNGYNGKLLLLSLDWPEQITSIEECAKVLTACGDRLRIKVSSLQEIGAS